MSRSFVYAICFELYVVGKEERKEKEERRKAKLKFSHSIFSIVGKVNQTLKVLRGTTVSLK